MIITNRRNRGVSFMPGLLSFMLTIIIGVMVYYLFVSPIPTDNKEPLLVVLGVVTGVWKDSMSYWWGSTRSSEEKNKMLC